MAAAVSKSMPGGIGIRACAGTASCWPKPPVAVKAMTRSPTLKPVTSGATALTTPATSLPGVNGSSGLNWYLPWMISTSGKLTPAACTSTTTWPAAGCGAASSSTTRVSGRPQALHTMAFICVSPFLVGWVWLENSTTVWFFQLCLKWRQRNRCFHFATHLRRRKVAG